MVRHPVGCGQTGITFWDLGGSTALRLRVKAAPHGEFDTYDGGFFVYSILLEWHLTRRADRETELTGER
ncbi:protein of unknown function [Burkholderia multivorans]